MNRKLMVGNWKMNKTGKEAQAFLDEFLSRFTHKMDAWIAPQSLLANLVIKAGLKAGLQNCSEHPEGAYTGELSARTFKDMGGHFVILGHSERRQYFSENSRGISNKIRTALNEGLDVIYCVGETLKEREDGQTLSIIEDQIHQGLNDQAKATGENLIIAYEPVWAIGTGKTASASQAQEVHAHIRGILKTKFPAIGEQIKILYGGSVKPDNVKELLAQKDINGALVGGASLKTKDFLALCGDV
jgi:triosephosphate isomerase